MFRRGIPIRVQPHTNHSSLEVTFCQSRAGSTQRFRKYGLKVLRAKGLRADSIGSMFAMGFSGRFGRGGPGLSVSEVVLVAMEEVRGKRSPESSGEHQVGAAGGPRISA